MGIMTEYMFEKKLAFKKGVWYDKSRTNVRQDGRRQNLMLIQENLSRKVKNFIGCGEV